MGWSFDYVDIGRKAFIENLCAGFSHSTEHLEHRVVGNRVWHLYRIKGTDRVSIALSLIAKERGGGWGYKGMSEDCGPYYYDCPLSLLAKASPAACEFAVEWREKVRAHHAAEAQRKAVAEGDIVEFCGHQYRLGASAGPRKGRVATRISDGAVYRMRAHQLARATLCHPVNPSA